MNILKYTPTLRGPFEEMLVDYFSDDLQSGLPEAFIHGKLMDLFTEQSAKGIIHIAIVEESGIPIGFAIYQIDTPESDWCKRPGWGFIREFFIRRTHRRRGCGTKLAAFVEQQLRCSGASQLYLTADDATEFWMSCGYCNTHDVCSNDLEILIK